jgi:hypothetical protein
MFHTVQIHPDRKFPEVNKRRKEIEKHCNFRNVCACLSKAQSIAVDSAH